MLKILVRTRRIGAGLERPRPASSVAADHRLATAASDAGPDRPSPGPVARIAGAVRRAGALIGLAAGLAAGLEIGVGLLPGAAAGAGGFAALLAIGTGVGALLAYLAVRWTGVALVAEDFYTYLTGGDSVIGRLIERMQEAGGGLGAAPGGGRRRRRGGSARRGAAGCRRGRAGCAGAGRAAAGGTRVRCGGGRALGAGASPRWRCAPGTRRAARSRSARRRW